MISALLLTAIGVIFYLPAIRAVNLVAVPRVIARETPPFSAGDVVLFTPRNEGKRYSPGTVVVYENIPVTVPLGPGRALRVEGERIDRILATEGQHVTWQNRKLNVDGQAASWGPLNASWNSADLDVVVPPGNYLIFPSHLDPNTTTLDAPTLRSLCIVSEYAVAGRVWWQQLPLRRMGPIR